MSGSVGLTSKLLPCPFDPGIVSIVVSLSVDFYMYVLEENKTRSESAGVVATINVR